MIEVKGLYKKFDNLDVLNGIDLEVKEGEVVVIVGPSGSGKSTFLRCLNLLETPDKGSIEIDNVIVDAENIEKNNIINLRKKSAFVFQNYNLFKNKTALENIIESLIVVKKMDKKEAEKIGLELLTRVGLKDKANSYPSQLSGGQQQRVGIARAMAVNPKVILFDEPTSALDPELVDEVLEVILELSKQNITMVIVTHEMFFARKIADKIIFMDNGKIIAQGSPEEIFNNKNERLIKFLKRESFK